MARTRLTAVACASLALAFLLPCLGASEEAPKAADDKPDADVPAKAPPKEESSVTQHSLSVGGQVFKYTATAGTLLLKDENDEPVASVFYVAYTRDDAPRPRPLAFLYNGGPGSSSIWLHMGAFGPRRVVTEDAQSSPPPPYRLVDNAYTLLDKADLVFIDPVGTGFSRAVGKAKDKDYWGVDQDVHSIGKFIVAYANRNHRWNSPKYLIGESYGTFRSAALVNYLQSKKGMYFNGVVLISSVLDMGTIEFAPGDDRPYVNYLPSFAATAWYHRMLKDRPANLAAFLAGARRFAAGEYAAALALGSNISDFDKAAIARKLSAFTGLGEDYLEKADLRVNYAQFVQELERGSGKVLGQYDARFSGYALDRLAEFAAYDPQSTAITGAFTAAFNSYVRDELNFGSEREYNAENDDATNAWDWKQAGNDAQGLDAFVVNVEPDLASALNENPHLRVEVENGLYDLVTPFFSTEQTMSHLLLPPSIQAHVAMKYYEAGHMMYLHEASLAELRGNIGKFIESTASAGK